MTAKSSDPPRVMDITHPKDVRPTSTSKPVLITNRPMIAEDPMITQAAREAAEKGAELPAGAPTAPVIPPDEPTVNRQAKTVKPISVSHDDEATTKPAEPTAELEATPEPDAAITIEPPAKTTKEDEPAETTAIAEEAPTDAAPEPATPDPKEELQVAETPSETAITGLDVDDADTDEDDETRPETPEEKHTHDLEAHVAKGTYFVPINQVGKRRSRIIITIIIFVILGLLTLNLLLDMGILDIPGIPHTNYFSV